jgi:hypothetical protein
LVLTYYHHTKHDNVLDDLFPTQRNIKHHTEEKTELVYFTNGQ